MNYARGVSVSNHKHGFMAFLSLVVPGLGQLLKGHFFKFLFIVFSVVVLFVVTYITGGLGLIVYLVFWLWNIADAYSSN